MALRRETPASNPPFEADESDTAVVNAAETVSPAAARPVTVEAAAETVQTAEPVQTEAPAATQVPPAVQHAVANVVSGALATSNRADAGAFAQEVEAMKGAADFAYGNYKVFKGNNGEIMETNGVKLGRWVKVTMLAWDDHYEVSPGSKSDKSKDYVAYSKDGLTIDSVVGEKLVDWVGKSVKDYVNFLQEEADYPQARASRFVDIASLVHEAENEESLNGEVIQVTLSKSSIPSFESYQQSLIMKAKAAAKGHTFVKIPEDPFTFYFIREVVTKGENTWTKLRVATALPAKL